jgi:two-component system chemotaxis response regulator CheB
LKLGKKMTNEQSSIDNRQSSIIRVLVVDDSVVVRELLVHIFSSDPGIQVIGTANTGEEAIRAVERNKPDVITMDIHMPQMDGFDATRRIMETQPTPIIIVSGSSTVKDVAMTFRAMEAGALTIVKRPRGIGDPEHDAEAKELIQTVKLMSEVKVVRRWPHYRRDTAVKAIPTPEEKIIKQSTGEINVIAVGASTGGPVVLQTILSGIPKDFPVPLLIVQHMASGFVMGMVDWIGQSSGFPVHIASAGEYILPGHAYVAPDSVHMGVEAGNRITLSKDDPEDGLRPSVSYLFRSVSKVYGKNAVGVLLTGMGKDGAEELKLMKEKGAVTIAQDKESSVIYGMPKVAVELDAATYVISPERIAAVLVSLTNKKIERNAS